MMTKDEQARRLAERHYEVEPGITLIFPITAPSEVEVRPQEPIKLLEVNKNTAPLGIMPLGFGPAPDHGIHYPSVIVEITPDEYVKVRSDELKLPEGWTIGDLFPRPLLRNRA